MDIWRKPYIPVGIAGFGSEPTLAERSKMYYERWVEFLRCRPATGEECFGDSSPQLTMNQSLSGTQIADYPLGKEWQ